MPVINNKSAKHYLLAFFFFFFNGLWNSLWLSQDREGFRTCWSFNINGVCVFIRVTFLCTSVKYKNVHFVSIPLSLSQSSFFSIPKLLTNMKIEIGVFVRFSHRVSTTLVFSFCFPVSILPILILSFL